MKYSLNCSEKSKNILDEIAQKTGLTQQHLLENALSFYLSNIDFLFQRVCHGFTDILKSYQEQELFFYIEDKGNIFKPLALYVNNKFDYDNLKYIYKIYNIKNDVVTLAIPSTYREEELKKNNQEDNIFKDKIKVYYISLDNIGEINSNI